MNKIETQLRTLLMAEMSKRNTLLIAQWIGADIERFDMLMKLVSLNEEPIARRAAWVATVEFPLRSELIQPHLPQIVQELPLYKHTGTLRCMLKVLSEIDFPTSLDGELVNLCFDWVENAQMPLAIRALSMEILYRISIREPDLKQELLVLFRNLAEISLDPAILSKSRLIIARIEKLEQKRRTQYL